MEHEIINIIKKNNYLTLATVDSDEYIPLATPVFFAHDQNFSNFYWVSSIDSQHSQNIECNPFISIVIFDSNAPIGSGFGVFMTGTAGMVVNHDEIKCVDEIMRVKCHSDQFRSVDYYCQPNSRRIYKFTPSKSWINTRKMQTNQLIDQRLYITSFS